MSNSRTRKLARLWMERFPGTKYTEALRHVEAVPMPRQGTLGMVAGHAGAGATVALRHIASLAIVAGQTVRWLSHHRELNSWWPEGAELAPLDSTDYQQAILDVPLGDGRPDMLVLDNFAYAMSGDIEFYRVAQHIRALSQRDTTVLVRLQQPTIMALQGLHRSEFEWRLLMGRSPEMLRLMMFSDPDVGIWDDGRGQGWLTTGRDGEPPFRVDVPWCDEVQRWR